eukprot:3469044-Rhodomonas_salina.1
MEEQEENLEWLRELRKVCKAEREEEAAKKAGKADKKAELGGTAGGVKLQGVGECAVAKETTPAKPTKPAPAPTKPATVVSLVT